VNEVIMQQNNNLLLYDLIEQERELTNLEMFMQQTTPVVDSIEITLKDLFE
jgi:D-mannonate dehydratase